MSVQNTESTGSFIPGVIHTGIKDKTKVRNVIYLWSESWGETDDWWFVWEANKLKPYKRRKITDLNNNDIYPHYHYEENDFWNQMVEFIRRIPLTPVMGNGIPGFLIYDFGKEKWIFDIITLCLTLVMMKSRNNALTLFISTFISNGYTSSTLITIRLTWSNIHFSLPKS